MKKEFRIGLSFICVKYRFQVVLANQAVTQHLCLDSPYSTVRLFVRFLAVLVDCDKIATKLCSHKCKCYTVYRKRFQQPKCLCTNFAVILNPLS